MFIYLKYWKEVEEWKLVVEDHDLRVGVFFAERVENEIFLLTKLELRVGTITLFSLI